VLLFCKIALRFLPGGVARTKRRSNFGVTPEYEGLGHGGVHLGVDGFNFAVDGRVGDGVDLDGAGSVAAHFIFYYGLGDLGFEGAYGEVGVAEFARKSLECVAVFFGHGEDLSGEVVAQSQFISSNDGGSRLRL
jgi:hypothetical protein